MYVCEGNRSPLHPRMPGLPTTTGATRARTWTHSALIEIPAIDSGSGEATIPLYTHHRTLLGHIRSYGDPGQRRVEPRPRASQSNPPHLPSVSVPRASLPPFLSLIHSLFLLLTTILRLVLNISPPPQHLSKMSLQSSPRRWLLYCTTPQTAPLDTQLLVLYMST